MSKPILIVQSYRKHATPAWIQTCLDRTETWARSQGYAYEFVGDELFDFALAAFGNVPAKEFKRVTLTDWCRLGLIRERLTSGKYSRVVWMDADLLVFDLHRFRLQAEFVNDTLDGQNFLGCHEVWHEFSLPFYHHFIHKVNNAILGFSDTRTVDLLLALSQRVMALSVPLHRPEVLIGTRLLTKLHQSLPFHLQRGVACVGPMSFQAWRRSPAAYGKNLVLAYRSPVLAANLCRSKAQSDAAMLEQVNELIAGAATFADGVADELPNLTRLSLKHLAFYVVRDLAQKANWVLRKPKMAG